MKYSILGIGIVVILASISGCIDINKTNDEQYNEWADELIKEKKVEEYRKSLERYSYDPSDRIIKARDAPLPVYNNLKDAQSDYQHKGVLVTEQTQRLDMYYAAKSGFLVSMTKEEYKSYLDDLTFQTTEFLVRNLELINSGNAYVEHLNTAVSEDQIAYDYYKREYDRVVKNYNISKSDMNIAINDIYKVIDQYNLRFAR